MIGIAYSLYALVTFLYFIAWGIWAFVTPFIMAPGVVALVITRGQPGIKQGWYALGLYLLSGIGSMFITQSAFSMTHEPAFTLQSASGIVTFFGGLFAARHLWRTSTRINDEYHASGRKA